MRLNTMQFDGDGGYDAPLNSGATAAAAPTATSYMSREDRDSGTNAADTAAYAARAAAPAPAAAAKAKAPKTIDKSNWDRGTKVSQSTVDAVKDAGRGNMGKVPQDKVKNGAPGYYGSGFSDKAPVSAEYKEAVKRVYPNDAPAAKAASPAAVSGATNPKQPGPKSSAFPPLMPPSASGATNPKQPGPKAPAAKAPTAKAPAAKAPAAVAPKPKPLTQEEKNKAISKSNNTGTALNDRLAYNIINAGKEGLAAFGLTGTPKFSEIKKKKK